jgi:glycosyltransferase involved in cell wall biosynthesis
MNRFQGRLALQQRVLPVYRAPFFDLLASACKGGMSLFAGMPRATEGVISAEDLRVAHYVPGRNIHLFNNSFYLCYQLGLIEWLEYWNPDALIAEANPRYLSTPSAVRWMHRRGKPVIGWGLGVPAPNPLRPSGHLPQNPKERVRTSESNQSGFWERLGGGTIRQTLRPSFLKQFDALICYSQRGANEYARLGFPREMIFVAHNSVAPPPPYPLPARPPTFNAQPCILFVGRLQGRKRVDFLLRACAEMDSQPRLVIVGDGPERRAVESLAKKIYPATEFIGAKHGAELKTYFTEADLFVLPGTGGLAVQEAMSYGLPVIVAQGDGTQDDLVRRENGWQIPPDDFAALVSTLKTALSDAARLRRMGAESYRIVAEEINIEKMVETFVTVLNRLC